MSFMLPMLVEDNFGTAAQFLFPKARPLVDFLIEDDGSGPVLLVWNLPGDPPSSAAVAAAAARAAIPQSVPMLSARRTLRAAGLLARVNSAINSASPDTQDAWQLSPTVDRNSSTVAMLSTALGLSSDQVDALFVQAAALPPL